MARYHSLRIWKQSMVLVQEAQQDIKMLRGEADIRDQMKRSSRSIVANICEGAERRTDKEYKQFLVIARGSASELLAWYEMVHAFDYITAERLAEISLRIDHLIRGISRFISRLADSG